MRDLQDRAKKLLDYMVQEGADEAACSLSRSITTEINYLSGKFSLFRTLEDEDAEVEIIKEQRYAGQSGNRLSDEALKALVKDCFTGLASVEPDAARRFVPAAEAVQKQKKAGVLEADSEAMFRLLEEFVEDVKKKYPGIVISELYLQHHTYKTIDAFSSGAEFQEEIGDYSIILNCSAVVGEQSSSFFYNSLTTTDLTTPILEREPFKTDLKLLAEQYRAEALQEGFVGPVIMTPSCVDTMLNYLLINFTGDGAIMTKSSPWLDCLGEQVAHPSLNLRVAPLDERFLDGSLATNEGFEAENYQVFCEGHLESFALSDYVARKTGRERAKNSENYAYFVMEPQETVALEDLIRNVDRGIYMMRFSGGMPAGNGDFSGVIKNSYLIENGKLTRPLREIMINGNLKDLFSHIGGYSSERINSGYRDLPWVQFDDVAISTK